MNTVKCFTSTVMVGAMLMASSAYAYNAGNVTEKCIAPKFRTFSPPEKKIDTPVPEIDPESTVSFTVSGNADPTTIRAVAKGQKLDLNIVDKKSYYKVSSKLPAVLTGKYVRIYLKAKAQKGECVKKDGWLMKVRKAAEEVTETAVEE